MILLLVSMSLLCIIMFLVIMFLIVQVRENVVLVEAYQRESESYMLKYDHLCSQLQARGFEIRLSYRSACYIEPINKDVL